MKNEGKKNLIMLVAALLLTAPSIFGQDTIETHFNGTALKFEKKGINKGEPFRVRVEGINTILHHTVFKFKDFQLVSKTPEGLKILLPSIVDNKEILPSGRMSYSGMMSSDGPVETFELLKFAKLFIEGYAKLNLTGKEISKVWHDPEMDSSKKRQEIELISKIQVNEWITMLNYEYKRRNCDVDRTNFLFFTLEKTGYVLSYYEILKEQNQGISRIDHGIAEELSTLEPYYTTLKAVRPKIMSALTALNEGAGGTIANNALSGRHFPDKDLTMVEVHLVDRFNPSDTLAQARADLFVKNKFRIDFSTGLSTNTLVQREFFLTKTDGVSTGIDNEKSAGLDLGIAALVHMDWKLRNWLAIGPTLGASFSLIDEKPRYILGLSGSFGRERSISLTVGGNFGKQQVLSRQVSRDGENYDGTSDLTPFESPPLASKIKGGFFIGITYNVTRSRKE